MNALLKSEVAFSVHLYYLCVFIFWLCKLLNGVLHIYAAYSFIQELKNNGKHFIVHLNIGNRQWIIDDVIERKKAFAHDFETACAKKLPIFLKVSIITASLSFIESALLYF
jgi:hypothetical protein